MTPDEAIKDVRSELNEPQSGGLLSDHQIISWYNAAQYLIYTKIVEADQNFFEDSDQSLGFIAGQEEYDLPAMLWDRKISRVTRTDLSQPKQMQGIRFQEKERYHAANVFLSGSDTQGDVYYLRGNKIGFKPTAQMTKPNNILIHFIKKLPELHYGEALSATSTQFTISSVVGKPSNFATGVMRAGRCSTEPNHYVGARIRFLGQAIPPQSSGGPVGQLVASTTDNDLDRGAEATVTAFNVQTKVVTFSPAVSFSTYQYTTYPLYVILSPIPIEFHDIMYQYVVARAAKMKGDQARYAASQEIFQNLWNMLVNTIEPRRYDENQHVRTQVDQHFD